MNRGSLLYFSSDCHPLKHRDKRCYYVDMPTTDYNQAWALQKRLVTARKNKTIEADIVLTLEHFPVFTTGRRGGQENLMVSKTFLKKAGIRLIQVERGGSITFHGPGQLVIYLIFNLKLNGLTVTDYVHAIEDVMLRTVAEWDIIAHRSPVNRGIWIDQKKLGSVGIAIRRGISFHGMALNVNLAMEPFTWINPCGLKGIQATSMAHASDRKITMGMVKASTQKHIETVFGVRLQETKLTNLLDLLSETEATEWMAK